MAQRKPWGGKEMACVAWNMADGGSMRVSGPGTADWGEGTLDREGTLKKEGKNKRRQGRRRWLAAPDLTARETTTSEQVWCGPILAEPPSRG
jgi:hypothetical protein